MPHTSGMVNTKEELLAAIVAWATDAVHGADAWQVVQQKAFPFGTILQAHGLEEGEHFYVGLMPLNIVEGTTYKEWLLTEKELLKFARSKSGFSVPQETRVDIINGVINVGEPDSDGRRTYYGFTNPDIFKEDARVIFCNCFKQFCDGLQFDEQPGGLVPPPVATMPMPYNTYGAVYPSYKPTPLMPGVGCPVLTFSTNDENIYYWLVKDRSHIKVITKQGKYYDTAYIGLMTPYQAKQEYPWPAVIASANIGAVSSAVTVSNGISISPKYGILFDYTQKNTNLTHGLFNLPTTPDESLSQFAYCRPDGVWSYAYNLKQVVQTNALSSYGVVYSYEYVKDYPTRIASGSCLTPNVQDCRDDNTIYRKDMPDGEYSFEIVPIDIIDKNGGVYGRLRGVYWPSMADGGYGTRTISGKKAFILPNCWEGRHWHYANKWYATNNNMTEESFVAYEEEDAKMTKQANCLIRLED